MALTSTDGMRATIKRVMPRWGTHVVQQLRQRRLARNCRHRLGIGVEPLSNWWGQDRGQEIARYYVEHFLSDFSSDVGGKCLEFQEDSYTTRFGGPAVESLDILHVDDSNPNATIIADLTKPNDIADPEREAIERRHDCLDNSRSEVPWLVEGAPKPAHSDRDLRYTCEPRRQ